MREPTETVPQRLVLGALDLTVGIALRSPCPPEPFEPNPIRLAVCEYGSLNLNFSCYRGSDS